MCLKNVPTKRPIIEQTIKNHENILSRHFPNNVGWHVIAIQHPI